MCGRIALYWPLLWFSSLESLASFVDCQALPRKKITMPILTVQGFNAKQGVRSWTSWWHKLKSFTTPQTSNKAHVLTFGMLLLKSILLLLFQSQCSNWMICVLQSQEKHQSRPALEWISWHWSKWVFSYFQSPTKLQPTKFEVAE